MSSVNPFITSPAIVLRVRSLAWEHFQLSKLYLFRHFIIYHLWKRKFRSDKWPSSALPASPPSFIPSVSYLYFGVDVFLHREVSCLSRPLHQRDIPTRYQSNQVIMTQFNERCKDIATDGSVGQHLNALLPLLRASAIRPLSLLGRRERERRVHFAPAAAVAAVVSACCKTIKVKIVRPSVDASVLFCAAAATAAGTATDRVCYIELVAEVYLIKWD